MSRSAPFPCSLSLFIYVGISRGFLAAYLLCDVSSINLIALIIWKLHVRGARYWSNVSTKRGFPAYSVQGKRTQKS